MFESHCLLHQANLTDQLNNGTCGYGPLQHQWPSLGGAVFSSLNTAITGLPMNGCGTCWEVQCSAAAANEVNKSQSERFQAIGPAHPQPHFEYTL